MSNTLWAKMHGGTTHFPIALVMVSALFDMASLFFPTTLPGLAAAETALVDCCFAVAAVAVGRKRDKPGRTKAAANPDKAAFPSTDIKTPLGSFCWNYAHLNRRKARILSWLHGSVLSVISC